MYRLAAYLGVIFFIFILWVIYMADTGQHSLFFDLVKSIPYGDKLGHLVLFGFLTLGANVGTKFKIIKIFGLRLFLGAVLVSLFVVGEELSQYFVPSRTLDVIDLFADFIGVLTFVAISLYMKSNIDR